MNSPTASSTSSSCLSFSTDSSKIFCHICGLTINIKSFNSHYIECKNHYERSKISEIKPLEEPFNFKYFLLDIENDEIDNESISNFNEEFKFLYSNRRCKICQICEKNMTLEEYLEHNQEFHSQSLDKERGLKKAVSQKSSKKILKFLKDLALEEVSLSQSFQISKSLIN